ncbi:hypothetical protein [Magnetospirillum sp. 64-120]|uniref:hypothetical protein n=1 Tax=Magnetospirillum sp. 64-120 TaxID=1895778 RepID=UPI0025C08369|nr:hypothetical protein [Magnetospirillum sp. 64-120]
MTAEEALAALKKARDTAEGWQRIAEILDQVRDSDVGGRRGKLSVSFIEEAAKASRYAPAVLRRMSAVRIFLAEFDQAHPNLKFCECLDGNTAQFSKLELFARLHKVAPEKALEIAGAVADGSLTQKAIDLIYREASGRPLPGYLNQDPFGSTLVAPAAKPIGKPHKPFPTAFHEACWDALKKDVRKLCGEGDVRLSREYRFTYFTPFAVAVGVKDFGIEFVDGFYPLALPLTPTHAHLNREIKEIAFQSPFFRRFWLLTLDIVSARKLLELLAPLGLTSLGTAVLQDYQFTIQHNDTTLTSPQLQAYISSEILEEGIPRR